MHLAEVLDPVRAEGDEPGTARARLHALHAVVGGRVAPQQVHEHDAALLHRQRPLQRVDLLYAVDAAPDACTHAQPHSQMLDSIRVRTFQVGSVAQRRR